MLSFSRSRPAGLLTALSFLLTAAAFSQDRAHRVETGLRPGVQIKGQPEERWTVPERLARHKVPAVSVTVINGGEIEWSRAWGVIGNGSATKVNVDTLFQAASISKPVSALAALRLVAKGKLDLDADVNQSLKSWRVPPHAFGKPVTLRMLLTHTAGTTVHGFPGYAAGVPLPSLADVLSGRGNTPAVVVDIAPGTLWRYSGGGYEIMQQLVQDVTGRPFAAVVKQLVLEPLDMTRSTFEQPLPERLAGNAGRAHDEAGKPIAGRWHTYPEQAAAGLWTRPLDLARVLVAVQRASKGNTKLLPEKLTAQMLSPGLGNQGLGWALGGKDQNQWFAHGGANAGYRCYAVAYPRLGRGAVVMTSSDNGTAISNEILRSISAEYGWPDHRSEVKSVWKLTPEQLNAFTGNYEFRNMKATVTVLNGEGLRFSTPMGIVEYLPESDTKFFPITDGFPSAVFTKDAEGRVTGVRAGSLLARRVP